MPTYQSKLMNGYYETCPLEEFKLDMFHHHCVHQGILKFPGQKSDKLMQLAITTGSVFGKMVPVSVDWMFGQLVELF